jgi:hypothetical protein
MMLPNQERNRLTRRSTMHNALFVVPTYFGHAIARGKAPPSREEFAEPNVPVLISEAEGLRIVLGTHDPDDDEKPDIHIERRPGGWAIFLHPLGTGDPSGFVYFLDDGQSFVVPENSFVATPIIQTRSSVDEFPQLDDPRNHRD